MTNIGNNRHDCILSMKDLIRDGMPQNEIIHKMRSTYPDTHKNTFYDWIPIAYEEIREEDENNSFENEPCIIETERQRKINLKKKLMEDLEKDYQSETDPNVKRNLRNDLLKQLKAYQI